MSLCEDDPFAKENYEKSCKFLKSVENKEEWVCGKGEDNNIKGFIEKFEK